MKVGALPASLLVSIDASPAPAAKHLALLLEKRKIPATWRVPRPAAAAEAPWMLGIRVRHEMALVLEDDWAGPSAARGAFTRELAWRLDSAKASGIDVSTVASKTSVAAHRQEILARHAISIVCDETAASGRPVRVEALRYGLSRAPVSVSLPRRRSLFSAGSLALCRKVIDRAVKSGQIAHLVIDAAVVGENAGEFAVLDQVLAHAARLYDAGKLSIDTMQSLLLKTKRRAVVPAKSIMRAA
jgi:hypothetical protein